MSHCHALDARFLSMKSERERERDRERETETERERVLPRVAYIKGIRQVKAHHLD